MNKFQVTTSARIAPRHGFSLLELLMVVAIVGVLCGLLSSWPSQRIGPAQTTACVFEIGQLDTAFKAYKEQTGSYPPDLNDATYDHRVMRFDNYIKFVFPQAQVTYSTLANGLADDARYQYSYYQSPGKLARLNLDSLDAAEALVFWLGGFPTPLDPKSGKPVLARKLCGFSTRSTDPFQLKPVEDLRLRTQPKFDFDETRLVDNDGDGWLEYVPRLDPSSNGMIPPYVYFDASNYTHWPAAVPPYLGYPATLAGAPNRRTMIQLQSAWGLAVPYASSVTAQAASQWISPISMQIICAGRDGQYSLNQNMRVPCYPSGTTYTMSGFSKSGYYDSAEADNLTNFSPGELQDQAPVAGS